MGTVEKIMNYLISIILRTVASRVEMSVVLDHARCQALLEDEARKLEEEGKPEQAEQVRRQARSISPEKPLELGRGLLNQFQDEHSTEEPSVDGKGKIASAAKKRLATTTKSKTNVA